VFVQASGVGIYGDQGDRWCDEDAPEGSDFPAEVCKAWERTFAQIVETNRTRKVVLRLGVVLGRDGGLLGVLGKLTRWFLGGHVGSGRQFISWIHFGDVIRMITRSIHDPASGGTFNANAPNPVSNADFMRELRRVLHRPWTPPVPKFAARIGSPVMGTEASLAFVSQRCRPRRFMEHQFSFEFPDLRRALENIYHKHELVNQTS
jgi:uncharacterized protein (TIGR01777 family)